MERATEPIVAVTIGDPCGIGPEVIVKALSNSSAPARVLLVGCADIVRRALPSTNVNFEVRGVTELAAARFQPGVLNVLDPGTFGADQFDIGQPTPAAGCAVMEWWALASRLALAGEVGAVVKGPVSKEVIAAGLGYVPAEEPTYLLLVTGARLRVAHLSDHVPLREALANVKQPNVLKLLRLLERSLRDWGIARPRIGVAGVNPHAQGSEERTEIAPAVRAAQESGIDADGPISPDTIFRQGTEGKYDCIVAHYHDQGHIAVKTWKFDGNCGVNLGSSFVRVSVPHGPAFDIAGRGVADSRSMLEALRTAASLAAGNGFPAAG